MALWLRRAVSNKWPRPSRIGLRLLAFNLLLVFLPVAGVLSLDVYEARLLGGQERAMVQQGRVLAAALGDRPVLVAGEIEPLLRRLAQNSEARLRVYDQAGVLVGDSVRHAVSAADPGTSAYGSGESGEMGAVRDRFLYRVGASLARVRGALKDLMRRLLVREPRSAGPPSLDEALSPTPEVRAALAGRYGASTRPTPGQRSLTMTSVVPVRNGDAVVGAVAVSQTTFRILQALYAVRLRLFEIIVASVIAAALLSVLVSSRIVRPIVRLRREASALAERRGALPGSFAETGRHDEIGELARALAELTRRLDAHITLVESFAADVSHEFKNPLASIRTAAEMAAQADDEADRTRFLALLTRDVDRLERLVSGVRELARIDAQLEHEMLAPVDVPRLLSEIVEGLPLTAGSRVRFDLRGPSDPCIVRASADRLAQVFENVLQNARSFAPAGSVIEIDVGIAGGTCRVTVADAGPGIPAGHLDRVFDRFFSYRPGVAAGSNEHAGLGLAIAQSIVRGYGGTIAASNRPEGGASVEIRLPLADRAARPAERPRSQAPVASKRGLTPLR
jgi:two-component system sensor histidine kinase ChvG